MWIVCGFDFQLMVVFQFKSLIDYVLMCMYFCIYGDFGVCIVIFMYLGVENFIDVQEVDIEFLIKDLENKVYYINQFVYYGNGMLVCGVGYNIMMFDGKKWIDWLFYCMDWILGMII